MEWTQPILFFIAVAGLFLWNRTESRADMRQMDSTMRQMDSKVEALVRAIHEEMKDFHGRLCAIEEKNKNKRKQP